MKPPAAEIFLLKPVILVAGHTEILVGTPTEMMRQCVPVGILNVGQLLVFFRVFQSCLKHGVKDIEEPVVVLWLTNSPAWRLYTGRTQPAR